MLKNSSNYAKDSASLCKSLLKIIFSCQKNDQVFMHSLRKVPKLNLLFFFSDDFFMPRILHSGSINPEWRKITLIPTHLLPSTPKYILCVYVHPRFNIALARGKEPSNEKNCVIEINEKHMKQRQKHWETGNISIDSIILFFFQSWFMILLRSTSNAL